MSGSQHAEKGSLSDTNGESPRVVSEVDTEGIDEKKLMRRIDFHIIPWLALLYFLNFMDRGNIGNAKVSQSP